MIKKEFYGNRFDGIPLYRTYSDANVMILQNETGLEFEEAIDIEDAHYTYTETDKPIEVKEQEATEADYQSALEDLGVNFNE